MGLHALPDNEAQECRLLFLEVISEIGLEAVCDPKITFLEEIVVHLRPSNHRVILLAKACVKAVFANRVHAKALGAVISKLIPPNRNFIW